FESRTGHTGHEAVPKTAGAAFFCVFFHFCKPLCIPPEAPGPGAGKAQKNGGVLHSAVFSNKMIN
ncbi:hypothetical protein, partial [Heyndrickxia coagulans]|uniref:hypothetical protein n=1 Tax=Heyndrickxia coagulans TaxID=1398 RepID=UPI002E22290C|nr:hypothetical protein [Heyndrickxia coagulans]